MVGSGDLGCGCLLLSSLVSTRNCHILYLSHSKEFHSGEARVEVGKPGQEPGVFNMFLLLL